MCHDRGYLVTQEELDESLDGFKAQFGSRPSERKPARTDLTILVAHNDDHLGVCDAACSLNM
jgi:DNA-directed RNA polymerase I, II, and III subunit RPABC1